MATDTGAVPDRGANHVQIEYQQKRFMEMILRSQLVSQMTTNASKRQECIMIILGISVCFPCTTVDNTKVMLMHMYALRKQFKKLGVGSAVVVGHHLVQHSQWSRPCVHRKDDCKQSRHFLSRRSRITVPFFMCYNTCCSKEQTCLRKQHRLRCRVQFSKRGSVFSRPRHHNRRLESTKLIGALEFVSHRPSQRSKTSTPTFWTMFLTFWSVTIVDIFDYEWSLSNAERNKRQHAYNGHPLKQNSSTVHAASCLRSSSRVLNWRQAGHTDASIRAFLKADGYTRTPVCAPHFQQTMKASNKRRKQ